MKNEITVIEKESTELTIEQNQEQNLSTLCSQKISERNVLSKIYERIISEERTPELAKEARECRLELVKVRTGINAITKVERAFSLAYQKLVIAWDKKETLPGIQMEEKLMEIEKHQERIDQEKRDVLTNERTNELNQYDLETIPKGLGDMDQEVYDIFLNGAKNTFEAKKDAEKKAEDERLEVERLDILEHSRLSEANKYKAFWLSDSYDFRTMPDHIFKAEKTIWSKAKDEAEKEAKEQAKKVEAYNIRKDLLLPLSQFCDLDKLTIEITNDEWDDMRNNAESKKSDYDKKQIETQKENERLKKEAEEQRLKQVKEDQERKEKEEEEQRVRDEELAKEKAKRKLVAEARRDDLLVIGLKMKLDDCLNLSTDEYIALHIEQNAIYQAKKNEEVLAGLKKEKEENEAQAKKEEEEKLREKALAPDKIKLLILIEETEMWADLSQLSNEESKKVAEEIRIKFQGFKTWAVKEINKLK